MIETYASRERVAYEMTVPFGNWHGICKKLDTSMSTETYRFVSTMLLTARSSHVSNRDCLGSTHTKPPRLLTTSARFSVLDTSVIASHCRMRVSVVYSSLGALKSLSSGTHGSAKLHSTIMGTVVPSFKTISYF